MLFYVVDNQTRAVSSMVELGYYAGTRTYLYILNNSLYDFIYNVHV